jgi:SsrA-binding protein
MRLFNRRAAYDYYLLARFEAGLVLTGPEVKSVRKGQMSLKNAFVRLKEGEAWLHNAVISPYPLADNRDYDPSRPRKLLLHKKELLHLKKELKEKKLTLVPVSCYTKGQNFKLEIALAKGKRKYEKKEVLKQRDLEREMKDLTI